MGRKITERAVRAFGNGENFKSGNDQIVKGENSCSMYLHGNKIAERINGDGTYISNAGWSTSTTKERLNGVLDYLGIERIYQKDFEWYLKGENWDGEWIQVA